MKLAWVCVENLGTQQRCVLATVTVLLQARPNSIAVFVPSEITTYCFYPGLQRDYMVSMQACAVASERSCLGPYKPLG
jgi:hypothetical protein